MQMRQRTPKGWAVLLLAFLVTGAMADVSDSPSRSVGEAICDELSGGEASFRIGAITESTEAGEELDEVPSRME